MNDPVDQDRFSLYARAQRKARRFQRLGDYLVLAIILVVLAGSAVGLYPELKKARELDEMIALEANRLEVVKTALRQKELRLQHLQHDVDYMEQVLRNSSRRAAKPEEILILIPPEKKELYQTGEYR